MRLISRAELSRLAGVSDMAITKQCRAGLAEACHGRRVDLDHPSVQEFIARHDGSAPAKPAEPKSEPPRPTAKPPARRRDEAGLPLSTPAPTATMLANGPDSIEDIEQFADMSLREIVKRFGSMTAHRDWLDMRKKQVDIHEKELKNRETEGELVPRDFVKTHVFGSLERANRQLLQDTPKTIARRLFGMAKSGAALEDAEKVVREAISSQLRPAKESAARALRSPTDRSSQHEPRPAGGASGLPDTG